MLFSFSIFFMFKWRKWCLNVSNCIKFIYLLIRCESFRFLLLQLFSLSKLATLSCTTSRRLLLLYTYIVCIYTYIFKCICMYFCIQSTFCVIVRVAYFFFVCTPTSLHTYYIVFGRYYFDFVARAVINIFSKCNYLLVCPWRLQNKFANDGWCAKASTC